MADGPRIPSEQEVLTTIVEIARQHLDEAHRFDGPLDALPPQRLVADLGLDSVQLLTLAMEVENHFEITLDEVDPLATDDLAVAARAAGAGEIGGPADDTGDAADMGDSGETVDTVADLVAAVRRALVAQEPPGGH